MSNFPLSLERQILKEASPLGLQGAPMTDSLIAYLSAWVQIIEIALKGKPLGKDCFFGRAFIEELKRSEVALASGDVVKLPSQTRGVIKILDNSTEVLPVSLVNALRSAKQELRQIVANRSKAA